MLRFEACPPAQHEEQHGQGEEQDQGAGHHHAAVVVVGLPAAGGQEDGSCLISDVFITFAADRRQSTHTS